MLHCGRQKAVNTLRELQYAGLVEIQKQGCGKPNRIYPKSYEAVPNTDFKKSGFRTSRGLIIVLVECGFQSSGVPERDFLKSVFGTAS